MNTVYPNLDEFLGTYFHQDWMLDDPTADAAVDRYLSEWPKDDAVLALHELEKLLSTSDDEATLGKLLDEMGCAYYPPGDSMTYLSWLSRVRKTMAKQLLE